MKVAFDLCQTPKSGLLSAQNPFMLLRSTSIQPFFAAYRSPYSSVMTAMKVAMNNTAAFFANVDPISLPRVKRTPRIDFLSNKIIQIRRPLYREPAGKTLNFGSGWLKLVATPDWTASPPGRGHASSTAFG